MKIQQISVFIENRPGHLAAQIRALAEAGINIVTLSLADTEQFGILRLIVRDWEKAKGVLEAAGRVVKTTEVLAIEVEDRPGGLAELLEVIDAGGINVEYMYAFTYGFKGRAVMIFRFEDPDAAIAALQAKGIGVLDAVDLFRRAEG
ncbi:amino acid-binding protein [Candidatus Sumerlaeota bacterium]|nr:amino acid-binding protein [Candidatus Sumerlaeota bacterium]